MPFLPLVDQEKKMPSALSISLKMSLNLIKTYLLDKSGQKHLISLDKWKSQGFEYSSGWLLNGRAQLNYTLKGERRNISKFCPHRNKSVFCTLFFGSAQFKKGPGRCARIFHICSVWENLSYSWIPLSGTAPHVAKTINRQIYGIGFL